MNKTHLSPLDELYDLAERDGVTVERFPLPENVSVSVSIDGACYIGIDRSKIATAAQETVHIAHELGHCETASFYNPYSPLDDRRRNERRADRWAIERLCPPRRFRAAYRHGCREIWEFAEFLGVTGEFAEKVMIHYQDRQNKRNEVSK